MRPGLGAHAGGQIAAGAGAKGLLASIDRPCIVRKNDEKAYGEYRISRLILEIYYYDGLAQAIRTGHPYQRHLDALLADSRMAHPRRTKPERATAGRG